MELNNKKEIMDDKQWMKSMMESYAQRTIGELVVPNNASDRN